MLEEVLQMAKEDGFNVDGENFMYILEDSDIDTTDDYDSYLYATGMSEEDLSEDDFIDMVYENIDSAIRYISTSFEDAIKNA